MTKTVYFDTNVFDHINKRIDVTDADLLALRSAVRAGKISILLSFLNIEEILPIFESFHDRITAEAQFGLMLELTDPEKVVKDKSLILSDDIHCYAQNKALLTPFLPLNSPIQLWLRSRTNFSQKDINQLRPALNETREREENSKFDMMTIRNLYKKQLQEPNFADYFKSESGWHAERLAESKGVLNECQKRGIGGLLKIRSVRLYIGAYLSLFYSYTVGKRLPKPSDFRDMSHAVSASAAEIFVTHDEKLAKVLTRIPIEDFQVMDLHGLLKEIC